jgi:hypothetical protein
MSQVAAEEMIYQETINRTSIQRLKAAGLFQIAL